jgi:hypothetical protein
MMCGHTWATWEAGWQDHHCHLQLGHDGRCVCHCGSQHHHTDWEHDEIDRIRTKETPTNA